METKKKKSEMKPRDDLDVIFRYFYKGVADLRVSEKTERSYRSRCPFCFYQAKELCWVVSTLERVARSILFHVFASEHDTAKDSD